MSEPEGDDQVGVWNNRVLVALREAERLKVKATDQTVHELVAARFAAQFTPTARLYKNNVPQWHVAVDEAIESLAAEGMIQKTGRSWELAEPGRSHATNALTEGVMSQSGQGPDITPKDKQTNPVTPGVLTVPLRQQLATMTNDQPAAAGSLAVPVIVELNVRFHGSVAAAVQKVQRLWRFVAATGEPLRIADNYMAGELTSDQTLGIISADTAALDSSRRAIFRIWPDFKAHPQIDATSMTINALPARRTFDSCGDGIVWAVVDSGIDKTHPHFEGYRTLTDPKVRNLHRDFTNPANGTDPALALVDDTGHGTHVAGIIAGGLDCWSRLDKGGKAVATAPRYNARSDDIQIAQPRDVPDPTQLVGMAPRAKLVSLKAIGGGGDDFARISRVIMALEYVRHVNSCSELPRIHGVNLSLGYEFDAEWFACGRSPLCMIVDQLVRSGVLVVVAAGNTGYVTLDPLMTNDVIRFSAATTINDPGNAERAITVGSTHRDAPHTYGVSYFSSRGPTGDGRAKPDLLAPGERILSAAGGPNLKQVLRAVTGAEPGGNPADYAAYVEQTGTSMAAPHVSGAVAAFLSVKREFIGRPEEIKRVFVASATSLNREPAWQGSGLINLLRALQSV